MNSFTPMKRFSILMLFAALLLISGCAQSTGVGRVAIDPHEIQAPIGTAHLNQEQLSKTLQSIRDRNTVIEDDPKWIKRAYKSLLVRKLNNVSEREYKKYAKYLDDGSVYIVVHPAFFPFFHYTRPLPRLDKDGGVSKHNVVERLLSMKPESQKIALLQAQERRMRDFLEFMSTSKKLVIVIVPRNYNRFKGYIFKDGPDEYTRYLNEVTNFSESILFVESRSPNRGYLIDDDSVRLMELLLSIKAETIYVMGGYIGRCLEDFYVLLTEEYGEEGIYVVPELSDVSPRELSNAIARRLLKPDGSIDSYVATQYLIKDVYRIQEVIPQIKHLD